MNCFAIAFTRQLNGTIVSLKTRVCWFIFIPPQKGPHRGLNDLCPNQTAEVWKCPQSPHSLFNDCYDASHCPTRFGVECVVQGHIDGLRESRIWTTNPFRKWLVWVKKRSVTSWRHWKKTWMGWIVHIKTSYFVFQLFVFYTWAVYSFILPLGLQLNSVGPLTCSHCLWYLRLW